MVKTHKDLIHLEAVGLIKLVQTHPELEYLFRHALVQEVAYNSLLIEDRKKLHRKTGQVIEETYPNRLDELAATLAHHFTLAEDVEKAIHYLHRAGQHATKISANNEAIEYFVKALKLLETLPDTPERTQQEFNLQLALSVPLTRVKGYAVPEVEQVYNRAQELGEQIGETSELFPVLRGLWDSYLVRAEGHKAHELGLQLLDMAQQANDQVLLMQAHWLLGETLIFIGDLTATRTHFEKAIALYDAEQYQTYLHQPPQDPGMASRYFRAYTLWYLGFPDQALTNVHHTLGLAQELAQPFEIANTLIFVLGIYIDRREPRAAQPYMELFNTLLNEHGFGNHMPIAAFFQGWLLSEQGQAEEGIAQMLQSMDAFLATAVGWGLPLFALALVEAYRKAQHIDEGLNLVTDALAAVERSGYRQCEAEFYRLKGELLLMQGASEEEVERQFNKAIDIARRQQAKSWELRATVSLCRLWQRQGKTKEAHQMLSEIYNWFTEGFDTVDLKEAKTLLDELT